MGNPYLPAEERKTLFFSNLISKGKFEDLELVGEFIDVKTKTQFLCKRCGTIFTTRPSHLYKCRCCPTCRIIGNFTNYGKRQTIYEFDKNMFDLLLNKEDGYKYCPRGSQKVKWVCPNCNNIIEAKCYNVYYRGISCKYCGDGISYPNKVVSNLLLQLDADFVSENVFCWSKLPKKRNYRYDFYVHDKNMIIEAMGSQHYPEYNSSFGSYEYIHERDIAKEKLAIKNGIKSYIKLDCRISDINFIKNSIKNTELSTMYNLDAIDWDIIDKNSRKSLLLECCLMFDKNKDITTQDIADNIGMSRETVVTYLKRGSALGLCSYTVEIGNDRGIKKSIKNITSKVPIIQISKSGEIIKQYKSIREAEMEVRTSNISRCLDSATLTAGGYFWKRVSKL